MTIAQEEVLYHEEEQIRRQVRGWAQMARLAANFQDMAREIAQAQQAGDLGRLSSLVEEASQTIFRMERLPLRLEVEHE